MHEARVGRHSTSSQISSPSPFVSTQGLASSSGHGPCQKCLAGRSGRSICLTRSEASPHVQPSWTRGTTISERSVPLAPKRPSPTRSSGACRPSARCHAVAWLRNTRSARLGTRAGSTKRSPPVALLAPSGCAVGPKIQTSQPSPQRDAGSWTSTPVCVWRLGPSWLGRPTSAKRSGTSPVSQLSVGWALALPHRMTTSCTMHST
mmetsp:Transcript_17367/g.52375  ORF Transcript_17367/g.52375 Transcript_17367/m.52375 type:complete len:205 (-) Transcript_17367:57-671(-)